LPLLPNIPTFKEQGYNLNESMWRGFAFKKGVPDVALNYITNVLKKISENDEWKSFCNNIYVVPVFEDEQTFSKRIKQETDETKYYLEQAGLLSTYKKQSSMPLWLVFAIIVMGVFLILYVLNGFSFTKFNYDQIIAGFIISFSIIFYYQTLLFNIPDKINITSPVLIPRLWIILLVVLNIILILKSKKDKDKKSNRPEKLFTSTVILIITLLLSYLILMQWLGYYISTPLFIISTMYILNYRKTYFVLLNSFSFVLISYFIFGKLLHIDLPLGILFT
jgi:membrane-associated HD superfamily phosphohydrolase